MALLLFFLTYEYEMQTNFGIIAPDYTLYYDPINPMSPMKMRKQRTSFNEETLLRLNAYFEMNQFPSRFQFTKIANELHLEKRVVRIWFCNKRQALKKVGLPAVRRPQPEDSF